MLENNITCELTESNGLKKWHWEPKAFIKTKANEYVMGLYATAPKKKDPAQALDTAEAGEYT